MNMVLRITLLGAIQIIRDTFGGSGFTAVSPNGTWHLSFFVHFELKKSLKNAIVTCKMKIVM